MLCGLRWFCFRSSPLQVRLICLRFSTSSFEGAQPNKIWTDLAEKPAISPRDLASALFQLAKSTQSNDPRILALAQRVRNVASTLCAHDVVLTMLACRQLRISDTDIWSAMCVRANQVHSQLTWKDIVNILNVLSQQGCDDKVLLHRLANETMRHVASFDAPGVANTLLALAKFKIRNNPLITKLCEQGLVRISDFRSQDIASTLSAFGRLRLYEHQLVAKLCARTKSYLSDFNAQDLSATLAALSKFGTFDGALIAALCARVHSRVSEFNPQDISLTLKALENFDIRDQELIEQLCARARDSIPEFCPKSISGTLEALATFDICDEVLISRLCQQALAEISRFEGREIGATLCALAKLRFFDKSLVLQFCRVIQVKAKSDSQFRDIRNIRNVLFALAQFDLYDEVVVGGLCRAVFRSVTQQAVYPQLSVIVEVFHSLFCLGHYDWTLYKLLHPRLSIMDSGSLSSTVQDQWFHCSLCVFLERRDWPALPNLGATQSATPKPSELHLEISAKLMTLGVQHVNSHKIRAFPVDIMLVNKRVVIEAMGPRDYCRDSQQILGFIRFKGRILHQLGYKVHNIAHFEWEKLTEHQRNLHLLNLTSEL